MSLRGAAIALSAVLAPALFAQQGGDAQIKAEFQKVLGSKLEVLSDKGKQDMDALVKNMDASERQAAQAKLAAMEAKAATPAAKAEIAKAYTALARQAQGKQAIELALKARQIAPDDPGVRNLTESVLKMARDAPSQAGASPAVASLQNPGQSMVNNIYVIMVNDSRKGRELAGRFGKEQVEVRVDRTGRLKDEVVDASWKDKRLVIDIDEAALDQNKHAPATLAPLVAKALDNGDFIREHGDGVVSQVEMALRGWFSTGKVGDQIMTKGENPIDTKSSTAGQIVGFFVDLFSGKMTQTEYGPGVKEQAVASANLNVMMKHSAADSFGAVAEVIEGPRDIKSGIRNSSDYYPNLNATKDRLRKEQ